MASYAQRLGGHAFNHGPSADTEAEYDRLRDAARREQSQHQHYAGEARRAYESGDGAGAHEFSLQSKKHEAEADRLNKQARDFIFAENNAPDKVAGDTIDLHGLYVEEAEDVVEIRIKEAQRTGQSHLHVIVGKGNHSPGHVQKIKPRVEQVCREQGLEYHTEPNEGRIYVNLKPGQQPTHPGGGHGGAAGGYPGAQHHQQQQGMQYGHQQQQQQQQHRPQHQMQHEEPQEKKEGKCCGLCIVM